MMSKPKSIAVAFLMTAALAACGGKSKKTTTPTNTGSGSTGSGSTGGTTYGGGTAPAGGGTASLGGGVDPCAVPH
jgi:hypothetical protein